MAEQEFSWKEFHHQIYQIYHGLIALTLVPFALLFLEWNSPEELEDPQVFISSTILYAVIFPLFVALESYISWYVWNGSRVQVQTSESDTLQEKLTEFKKRNLIKYLILAGGGLLAALAMWLQPSFLFVVGYFAMLVQYSFLRPSEDKIVRDMQLTKADRNKLHSQA